MSGMSMKRQALVGLMSVVLIVSAASRAHALPLLTENFDNIAALPGAGWALINNSVPPGTTGWFQGNDAIFPAQAGAPDAYIAANYFNAAFGGAISNWLLTPEVALANGEMFSFFTRTEPDSDFPDRLEIRMSTSGSSANVGTGATGVGDFSNLLFSINPALVPGGYPTSWTQYNIALTGLGFPTSGRLGFRYYVGDTSVNGDYIGIDTASLAAVEPPTAIPEPSTLTMLGFGALGVLRARRRRQAGHEFLVHIEHRQTRSAI